MTLSESPCLAMHRVLEGLGHRKELIERMSGFSKMSWPCTPGEGFAGSVILSDQTDQQFHGVPPTALRQQEAS